MKQMLTFAAAAALVAGMAAVPAPARAEFKEIEASIPFVSHGGIQNWQAVGRDTLYVQDVHNRWYRARLMVNCFDLNFAQTIGFDARGTDTFDRFSAVIVRGQRCPVKSFVHSGPPPLKQKKPAKG